MAKMSLSEVWQAVSMQIPPRSPIAAAAAPAHPAGGSRQRRPPYRCPAVHRRQNAGPVRRQWPQFQWWLCWCEPRRRALQFLRSIAAPSLSSCTAIRLGANSTTWVSSPSCLRALAASSPSRPPPDYAASGSRMRGNVIEIVQRTVDKAARQRVARHRRHKRI